MNWIYLRVPVLLCRVNRKKEGWIQFSIVNVEASHNIVNHVTYPVAFLFIDHEKKTNKVPDLLGRQGQSTLYLFLDINGEEEAREGGRKRKE